MADEANFGRTGTAAQKGNGSLPEPLRRRLDSESIQNFRDQVGVWDERARTLFHERPMTAVFGALVLGYFFGRMFSRRWP